MTQNTEQNMRTDQIEVLTVHFMTAGFPAVPARKLAEDTVSEAEARGAAEQRRKDAEGQEPVAWVPVHPKHGNLWTMTTDAPNRERLPHEYPLAPLCTHPANVAALEARVEELEAEKAARDKAREHNWFYLKGDPESSYSDVSEALDYLCPLEMVEITEASDVRTFWAFQRADGEVFEFGTEEEARAALTREGRE